MNIINESKNISYINTKNLFGTNLIISLLSGKISLKNISLPLKIGMLSLINQLFIRYFIINKYLRYFLFPISRTFIISNFYPYNFKMWCLCDSITKIFYNLLIKYNIPYPNIILCILSSSELFYNWILHPNKLLPSYEKYLTFNSLDYNNVFLHSVRDSFQNKKKINISNVMKKYRKNGILGWFSSSLITRSIPFYIILYLSKNLLTGNFNLKSIFREIINSSLFLSCYGLVCFEQVKLSINKDPIYLRLSSLLIGLTLFLEPNIINRNITSKYLFNMAVYCYLKRINDKNMPFIIYILGTIVDKLRIRTLINMI